ncbi:MAG: putative N-acetylmannosamine-6-phosphate 2-epimerase [Fimbriimonas sp.]
MTTSEFLSLLEQCPLIASVQASEGSPIDTRETLARMALASKNQGVRVLRMQGTANIAAGRAATGLPIIGLIKRPYADSEVYITATSSEIAELDTEVIALDATNRRRPNGESLESLIAQAHQKGALVLADIDTPGSADYAIRCRADLISTTLGGYTNESRSTEGPDLELLRQVVTTSAVPVLAEGRFDQAWHAEAALRIGAKGVVIGGALNDPDKNTRRFLPKKRPEGLIGAIDIGGTWLRYATFSPHWRLLDCEKVLNPPDRKDRIDWIRHHIKNSGAGAVGVSTGGIVDPRTGEVWTAKEYLMPDHIGIRFDEATLGVPAHAHGDGHATAWAHACLPTFAGKRVASLALGTGVGCGFVQENRIWSGRRGEYPRINDLPAPAGSTYEDLLGGIHLTRLPTAEQKEKAVKALQGAITALRDFYFPDEIIIAGSVGLSEWLAPHLEEHGAKPSPFGADAGLYGAAALALFPCYL